MANEPDKHLVAIVDGNQAHRQQLADALSAYYAIHSYGDATNALMGLNLSPPGLVLVGELVPPSRGANFLLAMRAERLLAQTPAIFVSNHGEPEVLQAALKAGANDCLLKPYRRSALIRAISTQINAKVESQWKAFPPLMRDALQGPAGVFNSIADIMETGGSVQYWAVAESCSALVDAISGKTLIPLLNAVEEHDSFTFAHSFRVAALLALFGNAIGLPKTQRLLLASGGLLHDFGKLTIRHSILYKRDDLTPEEWEIIRGHVASTVKFLRAADDVPKGLLTIAAQHHERLDGSGYPMGLKAPQLNDLARIAAIADVFAGLTVNHTYKAAEPTEKAFKTMAEDMAGQLDQKLLAQFKEVLLDSVDTAQPQRGARANP